MELRSGLEPSKGFKAEFVEHMCNPEVTGYRGYNSYLSNNSALILSFFLIPDKLCTCCAFAYLQQSLIQFGEYLSC